MIEAKASTQIFYLPGVAADDLDAEPLHEQYQLVVRFEDGATFTVTLTATAWRELQENAAGAREDFLHERAQFARLEKSIGAISAG